MPKLPVVSGKEAVRRFAKLGYRTVRQKGSHIRVIHASASNHKPLTIPDHKELGRGLLRKLLRDADITAKQFIDLE